MWQSIAADASNIEWSRGRTIEHAFSIHIGEMDAAFECSALEWRIACAGMQLLGVDAERFVRVEDDEIGGRSACQSPSFETEDARRRSCHPRKYVQQTCLAIVMQLQGG